MMEVGQQSACKTRFAEPIRIFLIAGEHSGDQLGGKLMSAISEALDGNVVFAGVGGESMRNQGMDSLFPLSDVAVMGIVAISKQFPILVRRVYQTVAAALSFKPDVVVIIDSPEFTHPIAKRIRRKAPGIPILNYAPPSVWGWRPGRAKKMVAYVDHVMTLLPFEAGAFERYHGPAGTYVGHPLIERQHWFRTVDTEFLSQSLGLDDARPNLVVLPGSRTNEVRQIITDFKLAVERLQIEVGPLNVIIPTAQVVRGIVEKHVRSWSVRPHLVSGEEEKFAAFKMARVALAVSGTVSLELALVGTPMVIAYRADRLIAPILRRIVTARAIGIPNLILDENVFPELIQEDCTPQAICDAVKSLLKEGPQRQLQLDALELISKRMALPGSAPSRSAAEIVIRHIPHRSD